MLPIDDANLASLATEQTHCHSHHHAAAEAVYSTHPILLVHPYPWPMRTVAETGLTQTALAAAALQRSLCRRRRRTPSGKSPTRGSSSTRRVSMLADEEKLSWLENEMTIQGP